MRHATVVCIFLLSAFAQDPAPADKAARLKLCFEEAINCASIIKSDYHQSRMMAEIAEVQGRAGLAKEALETVEEIAEDYYKSLAYSDTAVALGKAGKMREAREILERGMKSTREGEQDFKTPDAHTRIAIAFAEIGDFDRAEKLATDVPKGVFPEDSLRRVARIILESGDLERALKLAGPPTKEEEQPWWIYGAAQGLIKEGRLQHVPKILAAISDTSLRSGATLEYVQALSAKGELDASARAADSIVDEDDKIEALAEIGVLRAKAGLPPDSARMKTAFELLDKLKRPNRQVYARLQLARWKAAVREPDAALKLVFAARDFADKIEEWADYDRAYIAMTFAELGEHDRALVLASSLEEGASSSALKWIAVAHYKRGARDRFNEVVGSLTHSFHLAEAHFEAAKFELERGGKEEARTLMRRTADHLSKVDVGYKDLNDYRNGTPEFTLLLELLETQAQVGDFEAALATALKGENEQGGEEAGFVVRKMARLEVKAGRFEQALVWIKKLKEPMSRGLATLGAAEGLLER